MNFKLLIIPYLDKTKKCNPSTLVGDTKGTNCNIIDLHFFAAIANNVLVMVRLVISLDAAHLRSEYKGIMLDIVSVLSDGNDIYHKSNRLHGF